MKTYRLDIKFYSPVVFYHPPVLDGLLYWCLTRQHNTRRGVYLAPMDDVCGSPDVLGKLECCIACNEDGVFLSSSMQYEKNIEYMDSWKKRFESKYAHMADFGSARRRIDTGSGKFRSYNMPLPAHVIDCAWWFFRGDELRVISLLRDNLVAVGKKASEGFGWIDDIEIRECDISDREIMALRPVPEYVAKKYNIEGSKQYMAWKPPYWLRENMEVCVK